MTIYVCDVVSECVHTGQAETFARRGGNRTRDLWDTSPMLYQLSYEVKSVRVRDISELDLVPLISVCFYDLDFFVSGVVYSGEDICL